MDGNEGGEATIETLSEKKRRILSLIGPILFTNKMTSSNHWILSLTSTDAEKRADLIVGSNVYWVTG